VYLRQRLEEMEKYALPDDSDRLAFKALTRKRRAERREAVRDRNIPCIVTTRHLAPLVTFGAIDAEWVEVPARQLLAFASGGGSGGSGGKGHDWLSFVREMRAKVKAEDIAAGIGPQSSALLLRMACFRPVREAHVGGMVETNALLARIREVSDVSWDHSGGSWPVRALLCRSSDWSPERALQSAGRGPVRPADLSVRDVKAVRKRSSLGRGPT
jgi:hypothetical protein